ncbi:MAG TPA: biotin--[acetyl-CoA-carboxylase] ligase, partial [Mycobacterium sp.]|nr:biotin--[acetyl-CoA-carboxylase] ligase [Mycobacterium sp.]
SVPRTGWGWLPLATGVAVADALDAVTGVSAGLKWPNDVLVDGGKLAGRIDAWRTAGGADGALIADYQRYSLTLGTRVRASLPGDREVVGLARGVDELGRLQVDTGGEAVTVSAGDITHLRPSK